MKQHTFGIRTVISVMAAAIVVTLMCTAPVCGQTEKTVSADTLTGEAVIAKYIEATGGRPAYDKITNRFMKAHLSAAAGLTMELTVYSAKPNLVYTIGKSPAIGDIEKGYDGQIFWEKSVTTGPRILEGNELADAVRETAFDKFIDWRAVYDKAELIGTDTVKGSLCYKVAMTPKTGKPQTYYFDLKTGLLVKVNTIVEHQMGSIPVDSYLEDYRAVDGVLMPYRMTQKVMGQEMMIITDSVANNVQLPPEVFKVPDDVKALIKK